MPQPVNQISAYRRLRSWFASRSPNDIPFVVIVLGFMLVGAYGVRTYGVVETSVWEGVADVGIVLLFLLVLPGISFWLVYLYNEKKLSENSAAKWQQQKESPTRSGDQSRSPIEPIPVPVPVIEQWQEIPSRRNERVTNPSVRLASSPKPIPQREINRIEPQPMHIIQTENPPLSKIQERQRVDQKIAGVRTAMWATACVGFAMICGFALTDRPYAIGVALILVGAAYLVIANRKKAYTLEAESAHKPIYLDFYNTEFVCPLATRATVRITVHFGIPRELNQTVAIASYYAKPEQSSHHVEQLNRVTEAKLIVYTQQCQEPPEKADVRDFLHEALAQFQDENHIPVLRVEVPLVIPVTPERVRGVNV